MKERWKPIPGYEGLYEVSSFGRVRRSSAGHLYRKDDVLPFELHQGYPRIILNKNGCPHRFNVHILVLETFKGKRPKGKEASHLDDIKTNNHSSNLEWMTHKENTVLAFENGREHSLKTRKKISESLKKYNARKIA